MKNTILIAMMVMAAFIGCSHESPTEPKDVQTNYGGTSTTSTTAKQCIAKTQQNKRCKNMTTNSNQRCHLHQ